MSNSEEPEQKEPRQENLRDQTDPGLRKLVTKYPHLGRWLLGGAIGLGVLAVIAVVAVGVLNKDDFGPRPALVVPPEINARVETCIADIRACRADVFIIKGEGTNEECWFLSGDTGDLQRLRAIDRLDIARFTRRGDAAWDADFDCAFDIVPLQAPATGATPTPVQVTDLRAT